MTVRFGARVRALLVAVLALAPLVPTGVLVAAHMSGSGAMSMGPDQCALTQIAFCDTFQTIVGGGREGDLDPAKWSFTRVSQQENPSQGLIDNYAPSLAEFCKTTKMVQPDNDSYICGAQFNESNHWMDSMDDNGQYVLNSARIRQPFDFANRTGNIVWDVDNKTEGPHSFWTEVWVTDQPVQGPHIDHPGTHSYPRNGVGFIFNGDWCGGALQSGNALREIDVFRNYQLTTYPITSQCFKTQSDNANHFQIQMSQSHINVFASDAGGTNFRQISSTDIPLNFSRGYVHFQHAQYNAAKFNSTDTMTYHWHAIGFDGPVLPADRGYEVPDALVSRSDGTVNLGYQVPTKNFQFANVNTMDVAQAYVTYSYWGFGAPAANVVVNGTSNSAPDPTGQGGYQWQYIVLPIPLTELHDGANTLQIAGKCGDQCPSVANIDLELVLKDGAAMDPGMPMPMPSDPSTTMAPTTTTTMAMPTTTTTRPPATTTTTAAPQVPAVGTPGGSVTLDRSVSGDYGPSYSLVAPPLSTSSGNKLLVAFLSADGPGMASSQSFTSVKGGGLTWTRVVASNTQSGVAEIWTAWSAGAVSNLTVSGKLAVPGYEGSVTVAAFSGASNVAGAVASAGASSGAPTVTLANVPAGSLTWAVGHDWDAAKSRKVGSNQTMVHQFADWSIGDTSWVQRSNSAANTASVTLSDTSPTSDSWNFAAIAIRPA